MTNDEKAVRTVIENWARAVESGDRKGILANHDDELLMFDFPDVVRGIEAYDKTWDFFFDKPKGPIRYTPEDLIVTASDQVAFATCLVHCDGTSAGALDFRLTTGLKKEGGDWMIVHEHHSVPTIEERFIGPRVESLMEDTNMSTYSIHPDGKLATTASESSSKHDFDFLVGEWKIRNRKLKEPLTGRDEWDEFDAVQNCRPILQGFGD